MSALPASTRSAAAPQRIARRGRLDPALWLVLPAAAVMLLFFVYPFVYGLVLSFRPLEGGLFGNYLHFLHTDNLWQTLGNTLRLAFPATFINVLLALAIAYATRVKGRYQRLLSTLLVVPLTLGTVLIAEGMLTYFGPQGWLAQSLRWLHLYHGSIRLTHNYWGVLISLVISGFPFAYLLILSSITGIDPALPRAAATLGADAYARFRHIYLPLLLPGLVMTFCLAFVQAFSVFPSAVLLGAPAGPTRVISIAAYEAAFELYDYSLASAIAMIMGLAQLVIVGGALGLRGLFYRGPVAGGKG